MNTKTDLIQKAYTYGYPIMGMYELLSTQVLNPNTRSESFQEFAHTASLSTPKTTFVPAPNNDTTYSRAWIDLRKEPAIIETPDTNDRYYTIQLLDLYSETITNIGRRVHGTKAQVFALVGPGWTGIIPDHIKIIPCDTSIALAFLRVLIEPSDHIDEIVMIQKGFRITSLSQYQTNEEGYSIVVDDLPEYDNSDYRHYFMTLNQILARSPSLPQDAEILQEIKQIGVGPGLSGQQLENISSNEMEYACKEALEEIDQKGMEFGEQVNFWRIARIGIGNYGTDYLQRAVVWHKGALANQPEESLYPSTFQDSTGQLLDGNFDYCLHFAKSEIPPVSQFWSLTMYLFKNAFLVENPINRYSIGDRTKGLVFDDDGGLTIVIQSEAPSHPKELANWLPAPKEKFYMTLRLYGPSQAAITGSWQPPAVQRNAL